MRQSGPCLEQPASAPEQTVRHLVDCGSLRTGARSSTCSPTSQAFLVSLGENDPIVKFTGKFGLSVSVAGLAHMHMHVPSPYLRGGAYRCKGSPEVQDSLLRHRTSYVQRHQCCMCLPFS